jgi:hypothetical protein
MLFYYYDYLLIQKYLKVLEINDNLALIKLKDYSFKITGNYLKITYFSKEELKIEGEIKTIEIIYE